MKKIIIGGSGFIGTSLAKNLRNEDHDVIVIDSKNRLLKNEDLLSDIKCYEMDFPTLDTKLLNSLFSEGDVLIHLACTTNPSKSMKNIIHDAQTNILPSIELFSMAIENKLSKIIFASSGGTIYGDTNTPTITESHTKSPLSAYGVSKFTIENYLNFLTLNSSTQGISLRIGNPYGEYQLKGVSIGAIAAFLNAIKNDQKIKIWGNGEIIRDYLYIDDLYNAFYQVLQKDNIQGSFNIGSGKGYSINQLLGVINKITGKKTHVVYLEKRGYDVPKIILNSTKFNKITGWECNLSITQGITKIWNKIRGF